MSVLRAYSFNCRCSRAVQVPLARSINAPRAPALLDAALKGRLHRLTCDGCGLALRIERRLVWLTPARNEVLLVLAPKERAAFDDARRMLRQALRGLESALAPSGALRLEVRIGLDALRAHLRAQALELPPPATQSAGPSLRAASVRSVPSPMHDALAHLGELAELVRRGAAEIDVKGHAYLEVVYGLPQGAHLPPSARRQLETLFHHFGARGMEREEARMLEIRFGLSLEEDWTRNAVREDLPLLWSFLAALPDAHVASNVTLREILLELGEGGGWYDPLEHEIGIGEDELSDPIQLATVLRHEVGHAVHEGRRRVVDPWLEKRFGWRTHGLSDPEIDAWVMAMGGYGESSVEERRDVRRLLRALLGSGGQWSLDRATTLPDFHLWNRKDFGPRLAIERTGSPWWESHARWYRFGGKAFFANPWYATLLEVDDATLKLVARMPDAYAAMSHFEFFAELYAMHHDPANPRHRGMPRDVVRWLSRDLDARSHAARPVADLEREPYEEFRRPA